MPRDPIEKCSVSWEDRYGTTAIGNLPQHNVGQNLCGINYNFDEIMDGVVLSDFRVYYKQCPYSTEAPIHYVREAAVINGALTYVTRELGINELEDHTATSGVMIREVRGSKHGFLCVDNLCPYYDGTVPSTSGTRYFSI